MMQLMLIKYRISLRITIESCEFQLHFWTNTILNNSKLFDVQIIHDYMAQIICEFPEFEKNGLINTENNDEQVIIQQI